MSGEISIKQSAEHKGLDQCPVFYKRKRKAAVCPENNLNKFLFPSSFPYFSWAEDVFGEHLYALLYGINPQHEQSVLKQAQNTQIHDIVLYIKSNYW